jgi:Protein of unknown function (DUF2726)
MTFATVAVFTVAVIAVLVARTLHRENLKLLRENADLARRIPPPTPRKTAEEREDERLEQQLEAVTREGVRFSTLRVMRGGELDVFRAAMSVTRQPYPKGSYPFHVFPQVSLGQIIETKAAPEFDAKAAWEAKEAHRAINSKRCDLLIADRKGIPRAVIEYQGSGHNIGGTAARRDEIKRIALEKAGVQFLEITASATQAEIEKIIRDLLSPAVAPHPATGGNGADTVGACGIGPVVPH